MTRDEMLARLEARYDKPKPKYKPFVIPREISDPRWTTQHRRDRERIRRRTRA